MSTPSAAPATTLSTLRTVVAASMGTLPILAVVVALMGLDWAVHPVGLLVVLVLNAIAFATAELVGYRTPAAPVDDAERARSMGLDQLRSTTLLRMAVTEAPGVFAFAIAIVTGHALVYIVGGILALASMGWHAWPSTRVALKLERSLDRDGGRSQVSELFGGPSAPRYQQY